MMRLTYLWTWPADLLCWLAVLAVWVVCGTKLHWENGLWCELKPNSWPARVYGQKWAGVTLGHGGIYGVGWSGGDGIDTPVEQHEHVHVEQYEAAMLHALMVAALIVGAYFIDPLAPPVAVLACWVLGGAMSYLASLLTALARGEQAYMGSHLEEAAYHDGEANDAD